MRHRPFASSSLLRSLYVACIRQAFSWFYHEFAWTYDTVAWLVSRGHWRRWTLAARPYLSGRILEIGCGTGYVQHALAQERPAAGFGLDESRFMLALSQRRVRRDPCIQHEARLIRGKAQALPCASACFDSVLSTFPSEYIIHPDTLREVYRVLAPGGRFVVVDAAQFTTSGIYERLVDLAYRLTMQQGSVQQAPSQVPYTSLIQQAGFLVQPYHEQVGQSFVTVMVCTREQDQGILS